MGWNPARGAHGDNLFHTADRKWALRTLRPPPRTLVATAQLLEPVEQMHEPVEQMLEPVEQMLEPVEQMRSGCGGCAVAVATSWTRRSGQVEPLPLPEMAQ